MKRIISIIIAAVMLLMTFCGCGFKSEKKYELSVVTTIFPVYDWTKNILGERADAVGLAMLLDNGVDLHNFSPSADDIIKITSCDIFIYVGGESDGWVDAVLKQKRNKNMQIINLLDILGEAAKEEEPVEGMQEEGGNEEESEYDEHIWLSLKNAKILVDAIKDALVKADAENSAIYEKNAFAYSDLLAKLDSEYQSAVNSAKQKTVLFADRFPFRYLADDYGLTYYAAFSGCSTESEARFETVTFLANKIDELGLSVVFTIEGSDDKIAKTVIESTKAKNAEIVKLNSMQSITAKELSDGADYIAIMRDNLKVLIKALSE